MKRMTRVMSTRRLSTDAADSESTACLHLDAFNGNIGKIERAIGRNENIVNQYFAYSEKPLFTDDEQRNEHYIPPPSLPKLIKLTLKKPIQTMTLDQRWLLSHAFADSTLLHYACAGDQFEVTKLLLENGADWTMVNASNKSADSYAQSEAVKELFDNAEGRYSRLPPPVRSKAKAVVQAAPPATATADALAAVGAPPSEPPPPVPTALLKPTATGRRRQSIVNDASWTDSNLRSTVHHSQAPLVRSASIQQLRQEQQQDDAQRTQQRQAQTASFRRPDRAEPEEEGPAATTVPMSFGGRSLLASNRAGSEYSAAGSVDSSMAALQLGFERGADLLDDAASVCTAATATSSNLGGNGGKMNSRRRSRVVNSLRLRGSLGGAGTAAGTAAAVAGEEEEEEEEEEEVATVPSGGRKGPQQNTVKKPQSQRPVPQSAIAASSPATRPRATQATPALVPDNNKNNTVSPSDRARSPTKVKKGAADTKVTPRAKPHRAATVEPSDSEQEDRAETKARKSSGVVARKPASRKSSAVKEGSTSSASKRSRADKSKPEATNESADDLTAEAKGEEQPPSPPMLVAAQPPPLRVMRRLSVNMSSNALQAVSYVEGAQGEQQVLESGSVPMAEEGSPGKGSGSPRNHPPAAAPVGSGMSKLFGGTSGASVASSAAGNATDRTGSAVPARPSHTGPHLASVDVAAQRKAAASALVAESGEDAYLEAWECKATDQSPFARLQSSLLSGLHADKSVEEAAALIAKVSRMEKQEVREARLAGARAERLQQMMHKLTPLEHIASGVLRGQQGLGAVAVGAGGGVSRLLTEHHDDGAEGEEGHANGAENNDRYDQQHVQPSPLRGVKQSHGSGAESPASGRPQPQAQSLTYREIIWRRAGQHLNSALSDKQRNEYDRARAEAYRLGVRLLRQEFRDMAQREHWEAVDLVEQQRMQRAEEALRSAPLGLDLASLSADDEATERDHLYGRSSYSTPARAAKSVTLQAEEDGEGYLERTRHQSYRPFT
jgi:hypothetical protein